MGEINTMMRVWALAMELRQCEPACPSTTKYVGSYSCPSYKKFLIWSNLHILVGFIFFYIALSV